MSSPNSTNSTSASTQLVSKEELCALPTSEKFQAQTAFLIIILILTFIGNLLVVLAVIFFRRLRSITNYFVVSLAVSDLLIACISLPFRLDQTVHNAQWCLSYEACLTWIITDTTCSFASIWNLAIISIDRYVAIVHPFRYHSVITTRVGYGLIAYVWGFSFFWSLLMFINWTDLGESHFFIKAECRNYDPVYYTVSSAVLFFLPLLIVLVMYGGVFKVAFNQAKAMAALQVTSNNRGRRSSINLVREVKAAKTLAIVIGCFVVCWFPYAVLVHISLWQKELLLKPRLSRSALEGLVLTFVYIFPAINSTLNPIIYALFNREFRYAFVKLAKRITGQRLGAVGFGEGSMAGTTVTTMDNGDNKRKSKGIRFKDQDSESSEALPTIPMRDPNALYNEGCDNAPKESDNILSVLHDTKSMETTLDEDGPKHSTTPDSVGNGIETTKSNGSVYGDVNGGESSKKNLAKKLPPLERNISKSAEDDDVDFGVGKLSKPSTLPAIESTTNDELSHSPTEAAKSEHSEPSGTSLVNVAASEQADEDKTNNRTDSAC